jgi:DNA polymerase III epsilon subunit family exonuclease
LLYTFLDFETTGLDHERDQIIEVGMVKSDLTDQNVFMKQFFVKLEDGRTLSDYIKQFTGLSDPDLIGGLSIKEAEAEIAEFVKGTIVVAHNASFDLGFIKNIFVPKFYCTRSICKVIEPTKKANLEEICKRYEISLNRDSGHRAVNDAFACMEVFKQYRKMLSGNNGLKIFLNKMVGSEDHPLRYVPNNAVVANFG